VEFDSTIQISKIFSRTGKINSRYTKMSLIDKDVSKPNKKKPEEKMYLSYFSFNYESLL